MTKLTKMSTFPAGDHIPKDADVEHQPLEILKHQLAFVLEVQKVETHLCLLMIRPVQHDGQVLHELLAVDAIIATTIHYIE